MRGARAALSLFALAWASSFASCSGSSSPPPAAGPLDTTSVARVGDTQIPIALVASVAGAQKIAPRRALDALVEDALFANGARARKYDETLENKDRERSAAARLVLRRLQADAHPNDPPNEKEMASLTSIYWSDVERGEAIRAAIALVEKEKLHKPEPSADGKDEQRRALAAKLAHAEVGATTFEQFEELAHAVPDEGLKITIQRLDPFVADGRVLHGGMYDMDFVNGAFAMKSSERVSDVVSAPNFGWFVIFIEERLPAVNMPYEERRARFQRPAFDQRAKDLFDAHVDDLKKTTPVTISQSAETDMAAAMTLFQ